MATNKDLKRWYSGKAAGPKDFARLDETGKIPPSQCPSEGSGFVITAASNKTVKGLQVPSLTDAQLHQIYNATVQGVAVTITDATGKMHFSGVTADSVSDEIFVSFLYFDKMVLEYGEGDVTTFKEIGSSGGGGIEFLDSPPADPSKIIGLHWTATVEITDRYWTGYGECFTSWPGEDSTHVATIACGTGGGTSIKAIASIYYRADPQDGYVGTFDENCVVYDPDGTDQMQFMGGTPTFTYKYVCNK